jgi:hypothetical protein
MIEYFYSLDYQVKTDGYPDSNHEITDETSINEDAHSTTPVGDRSSQHSDSEMDPNRASTPKDLAEDLIISFDPLSFHILMYSLADRMFIDGLKALSKEKVKRELRQRLDPDAFPQAIFDIYNSTPPTERGLRNLAVEMTMSHLIELRTSSECSRVAFPDSLVTEIPQFSSDLLVAVMNKSVSEWNQWGQCGKNWA